MSTLEARFWNKVQIPADPMDCWEWKAATRNGYGVIGLGGRSDGIEYAHRLSFSFAHYFMRDGHEVCHTCNNRLCVNPFHLYAGTRKDNMSQCAREGRTRGPTGLRWVMVDGHRRYYREPGAA